MLAPVLTLERFAELRAAIERTGDLDRVLADAAITTRQWQRHQRYWLGKIAAEIGRGENALADTFLRSFVAPTGRGAAATDVPSAPAPPPAEAPAVKFVPSYLVGRPLGGAIPAAPAAFAAAPAPPAPAPPAPAVVVQQQSSRLGGTALALPAAAVPALPFANRSNSPYPPQVRAPATPGPVGSGTAFAPDDAGRGPATPFDAETGPHGMTLARYVELTYAIQTRTADEAAILGGAELDAARFAAVRAHFDRRFSASARVALEFARLMEVEKKRATEAPTPPPARKPSGTLDLPAVARPAARPQGIPDLTVEQYAWVAATLRRTSPEGLADALAKLRLTPASKAELEAHWRARMAADADLQRAFLAALAKQLSETP